MRVLIPVIAVFIAAALARPDHDGLSPDEEELKDIEKKQVVLSKRTCRDHWPAGICLHFKNKCIPGSLVWADCPATCGRCQRSKLCMSGPKKCIMYLRDDPFLPPDGELLCGHDCLQWALKHFQGRSREIVGVAKEGVRGCTRRDEQRECRPTFYERIKDIASRPDLESLTYFLETQKSWIIPRLFNGAPIDHVAHALTVAADIPSLSMELGMTQEHEEALHQAFLAAEAGDERPLLEMGMNERSWHEVQYVLQQLLESGFHI